MWDYSTVYEFEQLIVAPLCVIAEPIFHVLLCRISVHVEQNFIHFFSNHGGPALCRSQTSVGHTGKRSCSLEVAGSAARAMPDPGVRQAAVTMQGETS